MKRLKATWDTEYPTSRRTKKIKKGRMGKTSSIRESRRIRSTTIDSGDRRGKTEKYRVDK